MSSASDAGSAILRGGSGGGSAAAARSDDAGVIGNIGGMQEKKTMLVFVVGGLSYLEIAAFRFLSRDPNFPYRILMATTKLVNGCTFLDSLEHQ